MYNSITSASCEHLFKGEGLQLRLRIGLILEDILNSLHILLYPVGYELLFISYALKNKNDRYYGWITSSTLWIASEIASILFLIGILYHAYRNNIPLHTVASWSKSFDVLIYYSFHRFPVPASGNPKAKGGMMPTKRSRLSITIEILRTLRDEKLPASRLCEYVNMPYDRLKPIVDNLEKTG